MHADIQLQRDALIRVEDKLGLGPVAMAKEMGTPYTTYKKWRGLQNRMPAVGWRCLELLEERNSRPADEADIVIIQKKKQS